MSSLVRFILTFKHDDSEIGDLARDLLEDPCAKRTWGYKALKAHLLQHGACDGALDALSLANSAFTRIREEEAKQRRGSPASPQTVEPVTEAGSR